MSDRDWRVPTNDARQVRERDRSARWLDHVVYYGVGQVLLFTLPALWLVYRNARHVALTRTGAAVALLVVPVALGTLRALGRVPRLEAATLGTGPGTRAYLRRVALLNATLALAAFGGGGVGLVVAALGAGGTAPVAVLSAAVAGPALAVGLVASFGALEGSTRALRARLVVHAVAVGLVLAVAAPLAQPPAVGLALAAVAALALADVALGIRAHGL